MRLISGEPPAGPWRVDDLDTFVAAVLNGDGRPPGPATPAAGVGPRIVAVDGHGGSGKTALAERLHRLTPGSVVVHTDDVAWFHSRFGWDDLMIDGILRPLRAGQDVRYQPPAWRPRGRDGHIDVPAASTAVFIEGVGASRREFAGLIDTAIWVQADFDEAKRRGLVRDMEEQGTDPAAADQNWEEWMVEEIPFIEADRPWERAGFIVAGTPTLAHDPETQVVTAPPGSPVTDRPAGDGPPGSR